MNWLKEALLGEYTDSSLLQRSGVIEKERLMTYFEQAMALMNDADFRTDLRKAYEARRDPQVPAAAAVLTCNKEDFSIVVFKLEPGIGAAGRRSTPSSAGSYAMQCLTCMARCH